MSKFTIEAKKKAREAVVKMYEAIQPICGTGAMSDAIESVDLAALAIFEAHDMSFIRCELCHTDELVELAVEIDDEKYLCESCAGEAQTMKSYLFDMGDSSKGPIGFCARVAANSPKEAAEKLNAALPDHVDVEPWDNSGETDVKYITIYFNNPKPVTAKDAQEDD